jgi:cytochrome b
MSLVKVWDAPLRVFHWSLVLSMLAAYITGETGGAWADWHGCIGIFILGLIIFRLIWGFVGTYYARFSSFFPTIKRLRAYFSGQWSSHGHNPLGALSVFALLITLLIQAIIGLFANDDIAFEGPLYHLVDKDLSDKLTGYHGLLFNGIALLIALHVLAILFYWVVKKTNLVKPMLIGYKRVTEGESHKDGAPIKPDHIEVKHLLLAIVVAAILVWVIQCGFVVAYFAQAPVAAPSTQNW